jgi:hypothetical protein
MMTKGIVEGKGWKRQGFEACMRLTPEQCQLDERGQYTDPQTALLWRAFKAGNDFTPNRGTFIVAPIIDGRPHFHTTTPLVHAFKSVARDVQRDMALRSGEIHAVFQQVSAFDPNKH